MDSLKCILIKLAVETRMPVTFDSQIQWWKFFLLVLENTKRYIWMYFWLKNSRFLAVKFAIQKIELFFYLCYNVHFYTSGKKAQFFKSQIKPLRFANFSTKNTFKYIALNSLKRARKVFTIVFDYQKLQAFLFPLSNFIRIHFSSIFWWTI